MFSFFYKKQGDSFFFVFEGALKPPPARKQAHKPMPARHFLLHMHHGRPEAPQPQAAYDDLRDFLRHTLGIDHIRIGYANSVLWNNFHDVYAYIHFGERRRRTPDSVERVLQVYTLRNNAVVLKEPPQCADGHHEWFVAAKDRQVYVFSAPEYSEAKRRAKVAMQVGGDKSWAVRKLKTESPEALQEALWKKAERAAESERRNTALREATR